MTMLAGMIAAPGAARADTAADHRADARLITRALPTWTSDDVAATIEPGEDLSCLGDAAHAGSAIGLQSVWYRIEPPVDLTLYIRAWTPGIAGSGLGIFEATSQSPLACGVDDAGMVLRQRVHRDVLYDIQLVCVCDRWREVVSGWQIEVGIAPDNDDRSSAKLALPLPYRDTVFLRGGTPDHKTAACETVPVVLPVPTSDLLSNDQAPNAWYRFDASHDDTLLARVERHPDSPDINVYELRDDGGAELVTCSAVFTTNAHEPYRPFFETTLAVFEVRAGHSYLIELDDRANYVENAHFSLDRAVGTDVSVRQVRVSAPQGDTGTLRSIDVELDASNGFGPNTYVVVQVCPVPGPDTACTELAENGLDWDTAGCVGDVRVNATAEVPFAVDPDQTNNTAETIVHLAGSPVGIGGGSCNFRELTALLYR
ncbi:MAG TPA: hypothetical protein VM600_03700 [Actinomycetota bacterium]|nr:hypothetical protein [Actinomycetota bacterium]